MNLMNSMTRGLFGVVALLVALATSCFAGNPTLVAQPGVPAPPSIPELARALKYDVNLIYEYVYTNIEYIPSYGVKKGALGTLLDGRGNDFDQAALMVALLRQSGYTANYVYGKIRLNAAELGNYLEVVNSSPCPVADVLTSGGIPNVVTPDPRTGSGCFQPLDFADFAHVWVSVTGGSLGSDLYVYDPSFKRRTSTSFGINLPAAMTYDRVAFLATAGGTIGTSPPSIQGINRDNLQAALTGYANNLVNYIRNNVPAATLNDVLGGTYIRPIDQPFSPQASLPYQSPGSSQEVWTGDIPNEYRTTLRVKIGGIDQTYFSDQIYGHRLTVAYDTNSPPRPLLYLDGILQGTGGTTSNTTIDYTIEFPFCFLATGPASPECGSVGGQNFTNVKTVKSDLKSPPASGYMFAIVNGWDASGRGTLEFHRRQLQNAEAAGDGPTSEPVLSEALNMVGYAWLAQSSAADNLADQIIGTRSITHSAVGIVGQVDAPYIDLPGIVSGTSNRGTNALGVGPSVTASFTSAGFGSALEWGTLDQNFLKASVSSISTVKLLDIANMNNLPIYEAYAANWSTVQPLLTNYTNPSTATINSNYIQKGFRVILPKDGGVVQGGWTGGGLLAHNFDSAAWELVYLISPNVKGGYPTEALNAANVPPAVQETAPNNAPRITTISADPIDLGGGAYLHDSDDLSIGSAPFPSGLTFRRSYNSGNRATKSPLGFGWSHNLAIGAVMNSDGLKGLGQDSPIDGAAAIVGIYVAQDLLRTLSLKEIVVASLTQRWLMDRLINNTVNFTSGTRTEQFTKLADGSYNAQLGSTNRLRGTSGSFSLQYKDGTTLAFNAANNIASLTDPTATALTFTYNSATPPLLTSVSNGLGRSLTLTYDGSNHLASVSDAGGRKAGYVTDGSGNLTSFVDPNGNITRYLYGPPRNGPPTPGLLTQIFIPSQPDVAYVTNTYDSLGRVATQANGANVPGNTTTWNFYFAGYRSEEVDPYGSQHVFYYNARGKPLFEIQDLAGQNRVTKMLYDGLDRPTTTIFPEGNRVSVTYDAAVNPWAHNIASVTRTPKPGSPLTPTRQTFSYNATWNKVTRATDPLGLISTVVYDSKGRPAQTVADLGGANATTTLTYNASGRLLAATDAMGVTSRNVYDAQDNLIAAIADSGSGRLNLTTSFSYDTTGNLTSVTDPTGNRMIMTYDAARRLLTTTAPAPFDGGADLVRTTNTYDADGRVVAVTRTNGATTQVIRTGYNSTGKVAFVIDPAGNKTSSSYDLADRLASVTQPVDAGIVRTTRYAYDATGQLATVVDNAGNVSERYSYTPNGKQARFTDARGSVTAYVYDGFDRLAQATYAFGTSFASAEAYVYNDNDNVTSRRTRKGETITFAYDTLNRLTTKTPPSPAPIVSYTYDRVGRITSVSDTSAAITAAVPSTGSQIRYTTSYTYDPLKRLTGAVWTPAPIQAAPAASIVTFEHSYNAANQRTGQKSTDNRWWYYPPMSLTPDRALNFGYDAENRLISANDGSTSATYTYDAQGRRKSRTVDGTTTLFVTDADNREVLEYSGATGQIQRWYAYGSGPNDVLNRIDEDAGSRQTLIPDIQGSIVATLDSGMGSPTRRGYMPYGESATAADAFGYTAQREDDRTALYYYRARMYAPSTGMFLQPDPTGYAGGRNLYAYVDNDPLNATDPDGEIGVAGALIGAGIDVGVQLAVSLGSGQSFSQAVRGIDLSQVALSAALGAVGNIGGGAAVAAGLRNASILTKELIGEAGATLRGLSQGRIVVEQQVRQNLSVSYTRVDQIQRSVFTSDRVLVEAKFSTSGTPRLSGPQQRALQELPAQGIDYRVITTTAGEVVGAGRAAGTVVGGGVGAAIGASSGPGK